MSPEARAYVGAALDFMQENFVYRDKIDWDKVRRNTLARSDRYDAIRFALTQLGDGHSFLNAPTSAASAPSNQVVSPFQNRRAPESGVVGDASHAIGRIVIPSFSGQNGNEFASRLQSLIGEVAPRQPCGWIVDLRGNGGGSMWPMLAGVGPILGEGEVGAFLNPSGGKTRWYYEKGAATSRSSERTLVQAEAASPVTLFTAPPVAVLIDGGTASSGEAIAVAFRGRPLTRFFGQTTYGVANSTFPFTLSDGVQLFLVVAVDLDRTGTAYPKGISPDETVQSEAALDAGVQWLEKQQACR